MHTDFPASAQTESAQTASAQAESAQAESAQANASPATSAASAAAAAKKTARSPKAIIIVPGIMGSSIYANSKFTIGTVKFAKGTRVWAPSRSGVFSADEKVLSLSCDKDGRPLYDVDVLPPIVNDPDEKRNYGGLNIYKNLYRFLFDNFSDEYDIVLYEFDWRKSQYAVAQELDAYVNSQGYTGVVLIAHSMGGNVTSYYLALGEAQRSKVLKHISIGAPYLGAEKLAYSFDTGDAVDNFLTIGKLVIPIDISVVIDNDIRSVMPNFPAVYGLLPLSFRFVPFLKVRMSGEMRRIDTYANTVDMLSLHLKNWNTKLYKEAISHQDKLFRNGRHVTTLVDSYYIVGDDVDTPEMVQLSLDARNRKFRGLAAEMTRAGDGMVTVHSALIGNTISKRVMFKYKSKGISKADHISMVDGSDDCKTFDFIRDVILGVDVFAFRRGDFYERYSGFKKRIVTVKQDL